MTSGFSQNLVIREVSSIENDKWDLFVNASPQGEVFHLSFYLNAWVKQDPEIHLLRLGCFDQNGNLVGGQAFLHKMKAGFIRVQCLLQTWTHIETPIVAGYIAPGSDDYLSILSALANKTRKLFLHYRVYFHPGLQDIRPYLFSGYCARPDYVHGWDLSDRTALLRGIKELRRFRKAERERKDYELKVETSTSVIDDFLPMYLETSRQLNFALRPSFEAVFREVAREMMSKGFIRFFSCRNLSGDLLAITTYSVNPRKKTAYSWQVAYNYSIGAEKDFMPVLDLFTIEELAKEVDFIDLGEGMWPSMYFNKDALHTRSAPFYVVEVAPGLTGRVYDLARNLKNKFFKQ